MRESTLKYSISVIIPAHNEERYVARCIRSIRQAARYYGGRVEIIVVCNRCTDKTAEIAGRLGARVLHNQDRCIAKVRNTGIFAAKGDLIVTIDWLSWRPWITSAAERPSGLNATRSRCI